MRAKRYVYPAGVLAVGLGVARHAARAARRRAALEQALAEAEVDAEIAERIRRAVESGMPLDDLLVLEVLTHVDVDAGRVFDALDDLRARLELSAPGV